MSESILFSIKKVLGLDEDYTAFDPDVIMHINSALGTLQQLGVGPEAGLVITDDVATWDDFIDVADFGPDAASVLSMCRTYVYLKVRLLFDPPQVGFLLDAAERQVEQYEWRIATYREQYQWTAPVTEEV